MHALQTGQIRVLLVDDELDIHNVVRERLKQTRDIVLVGAACNGEETLALCEELHPDILLLDILMPVMSGFEVARLVRERFPKIKILVLSSMYDHDSVQTMLTSGVAGYVDKSALVRRLVDDIRVAYGGDRIFSERVFRTFSMENEEATAPNFGLTKREINVLKIAGQGLSDPEIACQLEISEATVRFHARHIVEKLGARSRKEALVIAARNKLI